MDGVNSPLDNQIFSLKEAIFWMFGVIGIGIYKILAWLMPKTAKIIMDHCRKEINKDLLVKIDELAKEVANYKQEKHMIQNDFRLCREAIISNDSKRLEIVREILKESMEKEKEEV